MSSLTVIEPGGRRPTFDTLEERLWWARASVGITQQELADALGISKRTVSNYEAGDQRPKLNRLLLWAKATDVDAVWLAGDDYGDPGVTTQDSAPVSRRSLSCLPVTGLRAA